MSEYGQKAKELFLEGYNCAQAVVLAFGDVIQKNGNIDTKTLLKMASPFGGGMGRLREVCGSISGIFMVLGILEGYHAPEDRQGKIDLYRDVQQLAGEFQRKNGSILCRELLGLEPGKSQPVPEERTRAYYESRPCPEKIADAAEILENFLRSRGML